MAIHSYPRPYTAALLVTNCEHSCADTSSNPNMSAHDREEEELCHGLYLTLASKEKQETLKSDCSFVFKTCFHGMKNMFSWHEKTCFHGMFSWHDFMISCFHTCELHVVMACFDMIMNMS